MRELYRSLHTRENNDLQSTFKLNMVEITNRLREKFPSLEPLLSKRKIKQVDEDVDFEEFDKISSDN